MNFYPSSSMALENSYMLSQRTVRNPTDADELSNQYWTPLCTIPCPCWKKTLFPAIRRARLDTLQVNLGYQCNQSCLHCHVNAGPNRTEMMQADMLALIPQVLIGRGASRR